MTNPSRADQHGNRKPDAIASTATNPGDAFALPGLSAQHEGDGHVRPDARAMIER